EELGLQSERQLADFIEVDRALIRELKLAGLATVCSRERALLVAEQLRLEQLLGDRGAVDLDERPLRAGRREMDGSGDQILADAALTADQDGGVGVRDALDDRADGPHPGVTVEERRLGHRYGLDHVSSHLFPSRMELKPSETVCKEGASLRLRNFQLL